jgi:hypothetical protein
VGVPGVAAESWWDDELRLNEAGTQALARDLDAFLRRHSI